MYVNSPGGSVTAGNSFTFLRKLILIICCIAVDYCICFLTGLL